VQRHVLSENRNTVDGFYHTKFHSIGIVAILGACLLRKLVNIIFFILKKVVKIVTAIPKVSLTLSLSLRLSYLSAFSHSKGVGSHAVTVRVWGHMQSQILYITSGHNSVKFRDGH